MKLVWHWFVSSGNMFLDIINESLRLIVSNFILCSSRKRIYFVATVMIEEYEDSAVEAFLPKDRISLIFCDFIRCSSLGEWKQIDCWKMIWRYGKFREEIEIPRWKRTRWKLLKWIVCLVIWMVSEISWTPNWISNPRELKSISSFCKRLGIWSVPGICIVDSDRRVCWRWLDLREACWSFSWTEWVPCELHIGWRRTIQEFHSSRWS